MAVLAATLVDRVAEILTRYSMMPPGAQVGVAVSGGADSVVLLHVLHRLSRQFGARLAVLHLNHQLRFGESDADEMFVRELASSLDLPIFCERTTLPPGNLEQEARNARRAFFFRIRSEAGLDRIALGHTRSDQAETVLYRLLRGAGTAGLAGMRFVTPDGLIRPLLTLSRAAVREWAAAEGISWREDATNGDERFVRNRIRNQTLPQLSTEFNPNLESVLANTARVAQAEEDYWAAEIAPICERISTEDAFGLLVDVPALAGLHPAVQRRAIRHLLVRLRGDLRLIDLAHVDGILGLCVGTQGHDRVLAPGVDALRSFETLLLTAPGKLNADARQYSFPLPLGEPCVLPGSAGSLCVYPVKSETQFCANFNSEQYFPSETAEVNQHVLTDAGLMRPLYVRNWEPGDEIHRPGHKQPEKLKALFGEHRIRLWERRHWPVVVCGEEVVWVRHFGCAAKFVASGQESAALRLQYKRAGQEKQV
jgi:tRNA(Ile)-lysidine synthase